MSATGSLAEEQTLIALTRRFRREPRGASPAASLGRWTLGRCRSNATSSGGPDRPCLIEMIFAASAAPMCPPVTLSPARAGPFSEHGFPSFPGLLRKGASHEHAAFDVYWRHCVRRGSNGAGDSRSGVRCAAGRRASCEDRYKASRNDSPSQWLGRPRSE